MGGPSNPEKVGVVRSLTENVTIVSLPFSRDNRFKVGGRMTIVKMASGNIAVFGPIAMTDTIREIVASYGGKVEYLICPDIEHHAFVTEWAAAYPNAKVFGPEGLPEKRAQQKATKVDFAYVLTKANKASIAETFPQDFQEEFEVEYVDGHANKEVVTLHKPSRTLIVADMLFNLPAWESYSKSDENCTTGLPTKLFNFLLNGKTNMQSRMDWYVLSKPDKPSYTQSVRRIVSWDFDRVILAHGDVIETGGNAFAKRVFQWFLEK